MAPRLCKYGCQTLLEGFDEENRKFLEAGTGGLHTKERCQEAKAKLEQKNDHGNELLQQMENVRKSTPDLFNALAKEDPTLIRGYVDHTQGQKLKLKTITDPTPEGMDLKYNRLAAEQNIRWSQSHVTGSQYTMFVWYEEVTA